MLLTAVTPTVLSNNEETDTFSPHDMNVLVSPISEDEAHWLLERLRERNGFEIDSWLCPTEGRLACMEIRATCTLIEAYYDARYGVVLVVRCRLFIAGALLSEWCEGEVYPEHDPALVDAVAAWLREAHPNC